MRSHAQSHAFYCFLTARRGICLWATMLVPIARLLVSEKAQLSPPRPNHNIWPKNGQPSVKPVIRSCSCSLRHLCCRLCVHLSVVPFGVPWVVTDGIGTRGSSPGLGGWCQAPPVLPVELGHFFEGFDLILVGRCWNNMEQLHRSWYFMSA